MSDQSSKQQPPEILATEMVASSRLFKIESLKLKFSNGELRDYERMKGSARGAVMVVAITHDDQMLLIREYAAGTHNYQLGFPKGLIDPGETDLEAANRELMEETGYGAKHLLRLKPVSLAPGFFNAQMSIILATDLYEKRLPGDEPEPLELVPWPLSNALALLEQEDFTEARSVAALFLAKQALEEVNHD